MAKDGRGQGTPAAAVILAGGRSSRMGRAKALLPFAGRPLVCHLAATLGSLFDEVIVVAAPGQELPELPARVVRDAVPHQGPVGGICYGLAAARSELCFVTSCDVAFLNLRLISYLLSRAPGYDVVVPRWEDRLQPLHAVYRRTVVPLLEEQLRTGELRPVYLFDKVPCLQLGEEEIRKFDPEGLSFFNMNTPEDYAAALRLWQERAGSDVTCTVELFGAARLLARTPEVSLTIPAGSALAEVFAALAERVPALSNRVVDPERRRLAPGYACNINGLDFVRDSSVKINPGDRILILSADAGG
ncbi:MAG TPA: NTP transferase domain-containing protein [candidate division Zixibacteria bacterium]|nr:NTP transferase domain-containing protein [candidate division Zixibacteria bacterium]